MPRGPGAELTGPVWDEGPHGLRGPLHVRDLVPPVPGAGMALLTCWELRVIARSALVTEDPGDSRATVALSGLRVARGPQRPLQVTVTRWKSVIIILLLLLFMF